MFDDIISVNPIDQKVDRLRRLNRWYIQNLEEYADCELPDRSYQIDAFTELMYSIKIIDVVRLQIFYITTDVKLYGKEWNTAVVGHPVLTTHEYRYSKCVLPLESDRHKSFFINAWIVQPDGEYLVKCVSCLNKVYPHTSAIYK